MFFTNKKPDTKDTKYMYFIEKSLYENNNVNVISLVVYIQHIVDEPFSLFLSASIL